MTESPESRAEGCSISPQHVIKNKGKQPMVPEPLERLAPLSPSVSVPGKRLVSERVLPGVRLKEPLAETGSGLLPAPMVPNTFQLIKPKDEPFTDDMFMGDLPQYDAPIAVIHPGGSLFWNYYFFGHDFCPPFLFQLEVLESLFLVLNISNLIRIY